MAGKTPIGLESGGMFGLTTYIDVCDTRQESAG
jgi:hypothetical protein